MSTEVQNSLHGSDLALGLRVRRDEGEGPQTRSARITCLLPARNCAHDLPGYFESVGRFADAVFALDDGSTDETADLLASHPLVAGVLRNPSRPDYRGWDDSGNRNRLLAAVSDSAPEWIFWLDADERLAPDDAAALREFVKEEALPGYAYQFRVYRMTGSNAHWEHSRLWVARLFHHEHGQSLPSARLHFVPVPTSIPRKKWLRTTIRIQHLAGGSEERRAARYKKYLEADPQNAYQGTYSEMMLPPRTVRRWGSRPRALPLLQNGRKREGYRLFEPDNPVLSAVVISQNDEATISRTLSSVVNQQIDGELEVIVVSSGSDRTAEIVRAEFPGVTLVKLDSPALPGEARNAGLAIALGRYVSFPGSHIEVHPGAIAEQIRYLDQGYAMVAGTRLNGTKTWAGWAAYFLSGSEALPGKASERFKSVPSAGAAYLREALLEVGGFPEGVRTAEDTEVNAELFRRGYGAYRTNESFYTHYSPCHRPLRLLIHHFHRGRGEGRLLIKDHSPPGRLINRKFLRRFTLQYVPARFWWTAKNVGSWAKNLRVQFAVAAPLVAAGALAHLVGVWYEVLRPARGKASILFKRWPGLPRRSLRQLEKSVR